jgi:multidrug transporter EmrE-like cation transporter
MKTFVIWVTVMFIIDSFCSVVFAGKKIPVKYTIISGVASTICACWGMKILGWL